MIKSFKIFLFLSLMLGIENRVMAEVKILNYQQETIYLQWSRYSKRKVKTISIEGNSSCSLDLEFLDGLFFYQEGKERKRIGKSYSWGNSFSCIIIKLSDQIWHSLSGTDYVLDVEFK